MAKAAATIPTTWADFLKLILADVAKGPLLLADFLAAKTDIEKLLTDAGLPIPWANVVVPHDATADQLEAQIVARFSSHALFGGGGLAAILKGLGQFAQSPLGQAILALLLGKLGGGGTPAT
jgi:hypothetical protein